MTRQSLFRLLPVATLAIGIALLASSCSGDDKNPTSPGGGGGGGTADHVINIVGDAGTGSFSPNPITVTVGQTVAWKNVDNMTHTATSDPSGAAFNTGSLAPGATSAPITMGTAGSFPYHCAIHAGMTGTLTVSP